MTDIRGRLETTSVPTHQKAGAEGEFAAIAAQAYPRHRCGGPHAARQEAHGLQFAGEADDAFVGLRQIYGLGADAGNHRRGRHGAPVEDPLGAHRQCLRRVGETYPGRLFLLDPLPFRGGLPVPSRGIGGVPMLFVPYPIRHGHRSHRPVWSGCALFV